MWSTIQRKTESSAFLCEAWHCFRSQGNAIKGYKDYAKLAPQIMQCQFCFLGMLKTAVETNRRSARSPRLPAGGIRLCKAHQLRPIQ